MLFEDFLDASERLFEEALDGKSGALEIEKFMKDSLGKIRGTPLDAKERVQKFCRYFFSLSKLPTQRRRTRIKNGFAMVEKMRKENLTALPPLPDKKVDLDAPVKYAKKVGPSREELLNRMGIYSVRDLIYRFPRMYDDRRRTLKILSLRDGERVSATARIVGVEKNRARNYTIVKAIVTDGFSNMYLVWFNQEYVYDALKNAEKIAFSGIVKNEYGRYQVNSPDYEIVDEMPARITPVYELTAGMSQKIMRKIESANMPAIHFLSEMIPNEIIENRKLLDIKRAVYGMHFPVSEYHLSASKMRLAYEEFFLWQLSQLSFKKAIEKKGGVKKLFNGNLKENFLKELPFELTNSQKKAIKEIEDDLSSERVMNRLLQGDVGSGKTVVAEAAMLDVVESGYQVAFMAPTHVLASQHYERLKKDLSATKIRMEFLVGATSISQKTNIKEKIENGEVDVVIGTHALIQKDVHFKNLGLVVIDEQHKFGVKQRESLISKGKAVDTLFMTATPIPRTLSMTLYGDLDITIIDEMPKGRKYPKTLLVNKSKRNELFDFVKEEIEKGMGAFWVSPLLEESEKIDVKAAKEIYSEFVNGPFKGYTVGLLHGKMVAEEKEKVMRDFEKKRVQVLVSTTVIEVGIDVPHANVMVIEHPERFGLAQLHQLRGRIGRGQEKSYCFLLTNGFENERLRYFSKTFNGFELSNYDLKIRGPGEFMGTRQHGLPEFKVADLVKDELLLIQARQDATKLLEKDETLSSHTALIEEIKRRYKEKIRFVEVG